MLAWSAQLLKERTGEDVAAAREVNDPAAAAAARGLRSCMSPPRCKSAWPR